MIRVAIVDDHDLVREGIRALLEREPLFQIVGETGDGQEAIKLAERVKPDVMLMDVYLPGGIGGLEATEAIVSSVPEVKVIILTQYENREYIRRALRIGARGYLLKRSLASELRDAIRAVYQGQKYLHPAVAGELVDLVASGRSLDEDEAWAFDAAMAGATFADLCGGLCRFHAPQEAAARSAGLLRLWIETGLLRGNPIA